MWLYFFDLVVQFFSYTVEFEPSATALETEGAGYVVASVGEASGYVPYTAFSAKKSYLATYPEIIQQFTNALQKGMDYVNSHTPEEIAEIIQPQFAETDLSQITTIVTRYYEQDTWKENLVFEQDAFDLLQDILIEAGELDTRVPYEQLVTTGYAENAFQQILRKSQRGTILKFPSNQCIMPNPLPPLKSEQCYNSPPDNSTHSVKQTPATMVQA